MSTFAKKVTSAVAGLAIVFSVESPIAGVSAAFSGLEAAQELATLAIIEDQSANPADYRLGDSSSREELSKVISKLAGLTADSSDSVYLDTDFASGKIFETPSQFRVRMQKVEDHMNSAAFTRGGGLLSLAKQLRSRCKHIVKRKGGRIPK